MKPISRSCFHPVVPCVWCVLGHHLGLRLYFYCPQLHYTETIRFPGHHWILDYIHQMSVCHCRHFKIPPSHRSGSSAAASLWVMREVVKSRGKQSSQDKGMEGEGMWAGVLGIFYSELLLKQANIVTSPVIVCKTAKPHASSEQFQWIPLGLMWPIW